MISFVQKHEVLDAEPDVLDADSEDNIHSIAEELLLNYDRSSKSGSESDEDSRERAMQTPLSHIHQMVVQPLSQVSTLQ